MRPGGGICQSEGKCSASLLRVECGGLSQTRFLRQVRGGAAPVVRHDGGGVTGRGAMCGRTFVLTIPGAALKIVFALVADTVQSTARDLQVVLLLCGSVPAVLRQSPFITPPS